MNEITVTAATTTATTIITTTIKSITKKVKNWLELSTEELEQLKYFWEKNYKNILPKENFYEKIKGNWELFFIDIVWMGIKNIIDFIEKLRKFNDWIITKKELLLNSWSVITEKFQKLFIWLNDILSKEYPWKNIHYYIWWDEIWIFIEWVKIKDNQIVDLLYGELNEVSLEWRLIRTRVTKKQLSNNTWEAIFSNLDKMTAYSKAIEFRIDESLSELEVTRTHKAIEKFLLRHYEFSSLKKIDIYENSGIKYISFNFPKWIYLDWGKNTFELNEIIDEKTFKLIPNSPLIQYLEKNDLSR